MDVKDSNREYNSRPEVFHSRHKGHFHVNLVFHILEYFGLGDDADFYVSEIFNGFHEIFSARRNSNNGVQIYFGGVKQLRSSIFYQAFAIDRKRMTAAGIAIKYGCSYREVHRGLKTVGCPQLGRGSKGKGVL